MLCHGTGCAAAGSDVTIHLRRLESLTLSLKTSKLANVQICQNKRISGSLLRSELRCVVSCQNSIMGKLQVVSDSLQIICLWLCIGTTVFGEVLNWKEFCGCDRLWFQQCSLLRLCTVMCDPTHFDSER